MKLHHTALYVNDLEGAKLFFTTYFGAETNEKYHNPRTGLQTYFLTCPDGGRLEIMNRPEVRPVSFDPYRHGFIHVAFSVGSSEEVDTLTSRLAADGYEVMSGPRTTGDGYYESCVRAFEDILIEITE